MFGRQTESRFPVKDRDKGISKTESGALDVPSPKNDESPSVDALGRCMEMQGGIDDNDSKGEDQCSDGGSVAGNSTASGGVSTLSVGSTMKRANSEKENFAPAPRNRKSISGRSPRTPAELEREAEIKDRMQNQKLCDEVAEVQQELNRGKREIKDLSQQAAVKDRKIEELKRQVEHLSKERGEAFRRTAEAEEARNEKRKQLHEKDQELATLKKKWDSRSQGADTIRKTWEARCKELEARATRAEKEVLDLKARREAPNRSSQLASQQQQQELEARAVRAEEECQRVKEALKADEQQASRAVRAEEECRLLKDKLERVEEECRHLRDAQSASQALSVEQATARASRREEQLQQCHDAEVRCLKERAQGLESDLDMEKHRNLGLERQLVAARTSAADAEKELALLRKLRPGDDVDARVLHAERRAEEAELQVQRLQDWKEEQQLRELTMDASRLEEIKRVRQDVLSQVDDARAGLIKDNETLHRKLQEQERTLEATVQGRMAVVEKRELEARQRCQDLEHELDTVQQQLRDLTREAEEARCALEVQKSRSEGLQSMHDDEMTESQERAQSQLKALRAEHEAKLESRIADFELQRDAERAIRDQSDKDLQDQLAAAKLRAADAQWGLLTQASLGRQSAEHVDEFLATVKLTVSHWRRQVRYQDVDHDRLTMQEAELQRLSEECEALHDQNKEVQRSWQQAQQDLQVKEPELRRLQEREAEYERQICQMSDRMDGGHANPKQKIKLFQQIKEENLLCKEELKKKERQVKQLEMQLRKAHFFEAETSVIASTDALATKKNRVTTPERRKQQALTPDGKTSAGSRGARDREHEREVLAGQLDDRPGALLREKTEAQRQARANRRAAERVEQQYQHLRELVERVLVTRGKSAERDGAGTLDCGSDQALFQRLRELISSSAAAPPAKATEGEAVEVPVEPKTPRTRSPAGTPVASPLPAGDNNEESNV